MAADVIVTRGDDKWTIPGKNLVPLISFRRMADGSISTFFDTSGVDPMLTIRAATYWPAVAMKVEKDYGTISEGKYADIIAVRGDVLRYIVLLQRVDMVIKHGTRYK